MTLSPLIFPRPLSLFRCPRPPLPRGCLTRSVFLGSLQVKVGQHFIAVERRYSEFARIHRVLSSALKGRESEWKKEDKKRKNDKHDKSNEKKISRERLRLPDLPAKRLELFFLKKKIKGADDDRAEQLRAILQVSQTECAYYILWFQVVLSARCPALCRI